MARTPRSAQFLGCSHVKRNASRGQYRDTHLNAGFTLIIRPIAIRLSSMPRLILIAAFIAILSWRKPARPRIMRKLWSNLKPNHAMNLREQISRFARANRFPTGKKNRRYFARASNRSSFTGGSPTSLSRPKGRHRSNGGNPRL